MVKNGIFIFVEVSDVQAYAVVTDERLANEQIAARLSTIKSLLKATDITLVEQASEGDTSFLIGTLDAMLPDLFRSCVDLQSKWKGWQDGPPARIVLGVGDYENMTDIGSVVPVPRGRSISLTRSLIHMTPRGGVVVTPAVRAILFSMGLSDRLIHKHERVPGFIEPETFYEADHFYFPPNGERQPHGIKPRHFTIFERRSGMRVDEQQHRQNIRWFWELVALGFLACAVVLVFAFSGR